MGNCFRTLHLFQIEENVEETLAASYFLSQYAANDGISEEQVQIIHDFVQESRDLIDQLEPTIIELGGSCKDADCWIVRNCNDANCPRSRERAKCPAGSTGVGSTAGAKNAALPKALRIV
ncbi:MAG: hypothetical protein HZA02_08300 [Nitrospinae bacterium]|nr:hypothetical protein [Nitrospinota bacterium]